MNASLSTPLPAIGDLAEGAGTDAGGVEVGARPPAAGSLHRAGCEDGRAPRRQDPRRHPLHGLRKQWKEGAAHAKRSKTEPLAVFYPLALVTIKR
ncbi:MAG: hypothetical protein JW395_1779 [Nitrospira sp.]|nr:hypothetical protein [Nitrospira sp.]